MNLIYKNQLRIAGLVGCGSATGAVWGEFDNLYGAKPFPKTEENGYEIRFYGSPDKAAPGQDIFVGFATDSEAAGVSAVTLPETEYASFDVFVAKGYDSENAAMDKWLADNALRFGQRSLDGRKYVVECYNEKFKGGDKPDSVVEIWIPLYRH